MKGKKIYIYPDVKKRTNDYILLFHKSFEDNDYKVNNRFSKLRLLNMIFNIDSDIFIIHWVDVIPYLRFGSVQYYFLKFIILSLSVLKKDVIWVLHNKTSHRKGDFDQQRGKVKKIMDFMAKYSTKVLVHAKDGVEFYNQIYGTRYPNKVICIPHPVYKNDIICDNSVEKKWDFIVWGSISPYKNINEFFEFMNNDFFFRDKKILLCGKCTDEAYEKRIKNNLGANVTYINKFLSDEELILYISSSEMILFTYSQDSVISSGALIFSLNYCKPIIAPSIGNFKEFPNVVFCYDEFNDITKFDYPLKYDTNCVEKYISENTWFNFPAKVVQDIIV